MNGPTQQEIIDAVRAIIRIYHPTVISASIQTQDQPHEGFFLASVDLHDGVVLQGDDAAFDNVYNATWEVLRHLEHGGVAGENGMGSADLIFDAAVR